MSFVTMFQSKRNKAFPATTTWYLPSALDPAYCAAAYAFKGAANQAASYSNLVTPGTGDCTTPSAPTWDSTNGLKFDHTASQYVSTNVVSNHYWTFAIRFSDLGGGTRLGEHWMFGSHDHANRNQILNDAEVLGKQIYYLGNTAIAPNETHITRATSGVLVISDKYIFANGVQVAAVADAYSDAIAAENVPVFIGTLDYHGYVDEPPGSGGSYKTMYCQAFAMFNVSLSTRRIVALSTAMAAL